MISLFETSLFYKVTIFKTRKIEPAKPLKSRNSEAAQHLLDRA